MSIMYSVNLFIPELRADTGVSTHNQTDHGVLISTRRLRPSAACDPTVFIAETRLDSHSTPAKRRQRRQTLVARCYTNMSIQELNFMFIRGYWRHEGVVHRLTAKEVASLKNSFPVRSQSSRVVFKLCMVRFLLNFPPLMKHMSTFRMDNK